MTSKEFYDAQEHQLNNRLLETVRKLLSEARTTRGVESPDDFENLCEALTRTGFTVPVLYCKGYTRDDDPCGLKAYHEGECRWR